MERDAEETMKGAAGVGRRAGAPVRRWVGAPVGRYPGATRYPTVTLGKANTLARGGGQILAQTKEKQGELELGRVPTWSANGLEPK